MGCTPNQAFTILSISHFGQRKIEVILHSPEDFVFFILHLLKTQPFKFYPVFSNVILNYKLLKHFHSQFFILMMFVLQQKLLLYVKKIRNTIIVYYLAEHD